MKLKKQRNFFPNKNENKENGLKYQSNKLANCIHSFPLTIYKIISLQTTFFLVSSSLKTIFLLFSTIEMNLNELCVSQMTWAATAAVDVMQLALYTFQMASAGFVTIHIVQIHCFLANFTLILPRMQLHVSYQWYFGK